MVADHTVSLAEAPSRIRCPHNFQDDEVSERCERQQDLRRQGPYIREQACLQSNPRTTITWKSQSKRNTKASPHLLLISASRISSLPWAYLSLLTEKTTKTISSVWLFRLRWSIKIMSGTKRNPLQRSHQTHMFFIRLSSIVCRTRQFHSPATSLRTSTEKRGTHCATGSKTSWRKLVKLPMEIHGTNTCFMNEQM